MLRLKIYFILVVACFSIISSSAVASADGWQPPKPVTFDEWIKAGDDNYRDGKSTDAILAYTNAIEFSPRTAELYYKRGKAYSELGYCALAIKDTSRAIELNPQYADAYYLRGTIYDFPISQEQLRDENLAVRDYTKKIELSPDFGQAYYCRARLYNKQGKYELAIKDFNKVIEMQLYGYLSGAYVSRGGLYGRIGSYDNALSDLMKADASMNPWETQFALAQVYELTGKTEEALESYRKCSSTSWRRYLTDPQKNKLDARMAGNWDSYRKWL